MCVYGSKLKRKTQASSKFEKGGHKNRVVNVHIQRVRGVKEMNQWRVRVACVHGSSASGSKQRVLVAFHIKPI